LHAALFYAIKAYQLGEQHETHRNL
jgi:hypothetical protein